MTGSNVNVILFRLINMIRVLIYFNQPLCGLLFVSNVFPSNCSRSINNSYLFVKKCTAITSFYIRPNFDQGPLDLIFWRSGGTTTCWYLCQVLRGESECREPMGQLVRLFVPEVPRITLRSRRRELLAMLMARTMSRRNHRCSESLQCSISSLASAPECNLLAWL